MKETQCDRVLETLKSGEWLSMIDCLNFSPPITRLAARCWDLRRQGHEIEEQRVPGKTYSQYRLIKLAKQESLDL